jgi:hypothetical protein
MLVDALVVVEAHILTYILPRFMDSEFYHPRDLHHEMANYRKDTTLFDMD